MAISVEPDQTVPENDSVAFDLDQTAYMSNSVELDQTAENGK